MNNPPETQKPGTGRARSWLWVPSLYFAEGIPYVLVMTLSVIFYKRMGISNADIALYTSWLYLPWVIKPLWSPVVDLLKTKRFWILVMQLCVGAGLAGVALTIPASRFFQYTLAFFWLVAFSSATHDIAADGFYMLGLSRHDQAFFVGIRSTFYRIAMLTGQGLLVILAGHFEARTGLPPVEVTVTASGQTGIPSFDPGKIVTGADTAVNAFFTVGAVEIGTDLIPVDSAKQLVARVEAWNRQHLFYSGADEPSLQPDIGGRTGNMGLAWFRPGKKPEEGERIVLNLSLIHI